MIGREMAASTSARQLLQENAFQPPTSFDFYSDKYGKSVSDINVYYRSIIEGMVAKSRLESEAKEDTIRCLKGEVERLTKECKGLVRDFEAKHEKTVADRDQFRLRVGAG